MARSSIDRTGAHSDKQDNKHIVDLMKQSSYENRASRTFRRMLSVAEMSGRSTCVTFA
jgi:hypothetical protein